MNITNNIKYWTKLINESNEIRDLTDEEYKKAEYLCKWLRIKGFNSGIHDIAPDEELHNGYVNLIVSVDDDVNGDDIDNIFEGIENFLDENSFPKCDLEEENMEEV